jgi:hypothetical protein
MMARTSASAIGTSSVRANGRIRIQRVGIQGGPKVNGRVEAGFATTLKVRVDVDVTLGLTDTGLEANLQLMPFGGLTHDRETCPWKLLSEFNWMLKFCEPPTEIVPEVGEMEPEKFPVETINCADAV